MICIIGCNVQRVYIERKMDLRIMKRLILMQKKLI